MLEAFRRSTRWVIGGGYGYRETLEGGQGGGTITKDRNDRARHRQHPQRTITRPGRTCIRTPDFSLRCSNSPATSSVVRFRSCASGNICDLRSVNQRIDQVPYGDEVTVRSWVRLVQPELCEIMQQCFIISNVQMDPTHDIDILRSRKTVETTSSNENSLVRNCNCFLVPSD
jgi:hypothetical protein